MKNLKLNSIAILLLISLSLSAQDNSAALKKFNDQKTELAKLELQLAEKTQADQVASQKAQSSADANREAAAKLKENVTDKNLSTQARKAARTAQQDSREARKISLQLEALQKTVEEKRNKVAADEKSLPAQAVISSTAASSVPVSSSAASASGNEASAQSAAPVSSSVVTSSSSASPVASVSRNVTDTAAQATVVQRNIQSIPANTVKSDPVISGELADRIIEATSKSYPQQPGQPSIIINNIIVPSDYNRPAPSQPAQGQGIQREREYADREDYENYKAWLRLRNAGQLENVPSSGRNYSYGNRNHGNDQFEPGSGHPKERLTFTERFAERPSRNSGLWVIPMVGVHASSFKANFKDGDAKGRAGWNAGLDFRIHAKRFFVQPGVHYFNSSIRVTDKDSISSAPLLSGPRLHAIKVPLMLGVYLTKANSGFFKLNVKGGGTANYILDVDKNDSKDFSKDNLKTYSYGLNAGLGLEFGLLTLDVSHEWGISSLIKDSNTKNNVLRATLGLKL